MRRIPKSKRQLAKAIADVSSAVNRQLDDIHAASEVAARVRVAQNACVDGWVIRDSRTFEALSVLRGRWERLKLVRSLARKKTSGVSEMEVTEAREELRRQLLACELAADETPLVDSGEARDAS